MPLIVMDDHTILKAGVQPVVGILSGISFVSGLDYYKGINEIYSNIIGKQHVIPANPFLIMVSVDCDVYAKMLTEKNWEGVKSHLMTGIDRLVAAQIDVLCIASNTGHIAYPAIVHKHPILDFLHIADCTAR